MVRVRRADGVGRRQLAWVGYGVTVAVLATFLAFSKWNPFADSYELTAIFKNANDVKKRAPVRIAGVDVGDWAALYPQLPERISLPCFPPGVVTGSSRHPAIRPKTRP